MVGHLRQLQCTPFLTVTVLMACTVGSAAFSSIKLPAGSGHGRVPAISRGGVPRLQRGLGLRMEISDEMRKRLKKENEAPLRFPLLWMGAVVFGKGLTDAMITGAPSSCAHTSTGTRFAARSHFDCHFLTISPDHVESCVCNARHMPPKQSSSHQWAPSICLSRQPCSASTFCACWLGPPSFSGDECATRHILWCIHFSSACHVVGPPAPRGSQRHGSCSLKQIEQSSAPASRRASDMWTGCAYNPTCWSLGKPWFLLKDGEGVK